MSSTGGRSTVISTKRDEHRGPSPDLYGLERNTEEHNVPQSPTNNNSSKKHVPLRISSSSARSALSESAIGVSTQEGVHESDVTKGRRVLVTKRDEHRGPSPDFKRLQDYKDAQELGAVPRKLNPDEPRFEFILARFLTGGIHTML